MLTLHYYFVFLARNSKHSSFLQDVSSTFRTSALDAIKGLIQSIQQRLRPAFEVLSSRNFELSEDSYSEQDDSDPWVQHLLLECDQVGTQLAELLYQARVSPDC